MSAESRVAVGVTVTARAERLRVETSPHPNSGTRGSRHQSRAGHRNLRRDYIEPQRWRTQFRRVGDRRMAATIPHGLIS
jgi:hypothetical protein